MERGTELSKTNLDEICKEAMADKSVTNVSGWTEPNTDTACDEGKYRENLTNNATYFNEKITEALKFE